MACKAQYCNVLMLPLQIKDAGTTDSIKLIVNIAESTELPDQQKIRNCTQTLNKIRVDKGNRTYRTMSVLTER